MKKLIFSARQMMKAVRAVLVALALTCIVHPLQAAPNLVPASGVWLSSGSGGYTAVSSSSNVYFQSTGSSAYSITVNPGVSVSTSSTEYTIRLRSGSVQNYGIIGNSSNSSYPAALSFSSGSAYVNNHSSGFITASGYKSNSIYAFASSSSTITVVNSGTIAAFTSISGSYSDGIVANGAGLVSITNSGVISGFSSSHYNSPTVNSGYGIFIKLSAGNAVVNNTGLIYGSGDGLVSLAANTVVNLSGGTVTGATGDAIILGGTSTVNVSGRAQLISPSTGIVATGVTGTLNLKLVGGTPAELANAQAAALGKSGSFIFGGYTYSWSNFNVNLNAVSLEAVSAPQYHDLATKIDNTQLPQGFQPFYLAAFGNPNAALDELSGFTLIQGINRLEVESQNTFQSNLEEQLEFLSGASGGFSTANATIGTSSMAAVNSATSQLDKLVEYAGSQMNGTDAPMLAPKTETWDTWITGNVTLGNQDGLPGAPSYSSVNGSPVAGVDYIFNSDFKAGLLVGATLDGANFGDGSRIEANTEIVGMYGTWNHGPWLANLVIAGGPSQYTDRRATFGGTATSDPNGYSFMTQATTGYTFNLGQNFTATPEFGLQYTHLGVDGYTESGGGIFATSVASQDIDSLRTHLGGKVDGTFTTGADLKWIPEFRAAWYHECLDDSRGVATSLSGAPAFGSFNVTTLDPERDYALVGLGLNSIYTGFQRIPIGMFVNYDVQVGQSTYIQHSITGGVKMSF